MSARWPRRLVAVLALLLAAEGLASLAENRPRYRLAPLTGFELVPGYAHDGETVNLAGLRGAEVGPRRPDVPRILCVGGSTTWGHHVRDGQAWPALLGGELSRRLGREVEVLNGGVSGWGFEQVVLSLEAGRLAALQPDLVLLWEGWNWPVLEGNRQVARHRRDLLAPERLGWLQRSALARRVQFWILEGQPPVLAGGGPDFTYLEALAQAVPPLAERAAAACRARGARLALVRPPALVQRGPPAEAQARATWEALLADHLPDDVPAAQAEERARREHAAILSALDAGAAAAGLPLLDLAARLEAGLPEDAMQADHTWNDWHMDPAHHTPAGHVAVAQALTDLLIEAKLLEAAPGR